MPFSNDQLEVNSQQVLTRIGYDDDHEPSARIRSLVDDYTGNYQDFLALSYAYSIKDILAVSGSLVTIEGSIILRSTKMARLLERCQRVVVFVLTIGEHLEEIVACLAEKGSVLQATVLDAIGSGATEQLAACVEDKIRAIANSEGMDASRRFSPGYCDWEVSQQRMVFQALDDKPHGVRLTESCLMVPKKSISGIIGLGLPDNEIEGYNPCTSCAQKDCPGRRR